MESDFGYSLKELGHGRAKQGQSYSGQSVQYTLLLEVGTAIQESLHHQMVFITH